MSINRRFGTVAALTFLVLSPHALDAQSSAKYPLGTVKSLKCEFPLYATGTWKSGEPQAEVKAAKLSLRFDEIDTEEGTARAIGMFGATHMTARLSLWSLHFLQMGTSGTLNITTVFDKESRPGKLMAVHTRHEYTEVSLPGFTSRPEQYYGDCEVLQ